MANLFDAQTLKYTFRPSGFFRKKCYTYRIKNTWNKNNLTMNNNNNNNNNNINNNNNNNNNFI